MENESLHDILKSSQDEVSVRLGLDLTDVDEVRKAIVMSEILNRKY